MDSETIKNRLLKRRQSSEILVERTTPQVIEQSTKIFVMGPPRSGTTLIYSLIAGEAFLPECRFVSLLMETFHQMCNFGEDEKFDYYGHTVANLAEIFKKSIYDFLYTAALKVGGASTNRFIYKDPFLTQYLEYFPLFFGVSFKVVFCVRDPRDVVTSMFDVLKKKNSEEDTDALFEQALNFILPFYRTIYSLDEALINIDRDKLVFIKYEDIVTGAEKTVQNLENFLGMTINLHGVNKSVKGRLDETSPFYSENYGQPVTTQPIGRFKDTLTFEQIVRIEHVFSYYMTRLNYERMGEPGFSLLEPEKSQQQISSLQRELRRSRQQISSLQLELQKSKQQTSGLQLELQKSQQQASGIKLELQKSVQQTSSLRLTLSRMPLASDDLTVEKGEEALGILYQYYRSKELPEIMLLFENLSKINARLVAANLCLRHGQYRRVLVHLIRIGMMDPLALFSIQTIKIMWNGLMFHPRHLQKG